MPQWPQLYNTVNTPFNYVIIWPQNITKELLLSEVNLYLHSLTRMSYRGDEREEGVLGPGHPSPPTQEYSNNYYTDINT